MSGIHISRHDMALPYRNQFADLLHELANERYLHDGVSFSRQFIKLIFLAQLCNLVADDSEYIPNFFATDPGITVDLSTFANRYSWLLKDIQFGWVEHLDISQGSDQFTASILNAYTNFAGYRFGTMTDLIDGRLKTYSEARFTIDTDALLENIKLLSAKIFNQPFIRSFFDMSFLVRNSSTLSESALSLAESGESQREIERSLKVTQYKLLDSFKKYLNSRFDSDMQSLPVERVPQRLSYAEYAKRTSSRTKKMMLASMTAGMLFTSLPEHWLSDKLPIFDNAHDLSATAFASDVIARVATAGVLCFGTLCIDACMKRYQYHKFMKNPFKPTAPVRYTSTDALLVGASAAGAGFRASAPKDGYNQLPTDREAAL